MVGRGEHPAGTLARRATSTLLHWWLAVSSIRLLQQTSPLPPRRRRIPRLSRMAHGLRIGTQRAAARRVSTAAGRLPDGHRVYCTPPGSVKVRALHRRDQPTTTEWVVPHGTDEVDILICGYWLKVCAAPTALVKVRHPLPSTSLPVAFWPTVPRLGRRDRPTRKTPLTGHDYGKDGAASTLLCRQATPLAPTHRGCGGLRLEAGTARKLRKSGLPTTRTLGRTDHSGTGGSQASSQLLSRRKRHKKTEAGRVAPPVFVGG